MPPPRRLTMRNAGQHVAVDACESTVCAPTSADQSPRLAPAAAARRAHDAASTTPSRSPSPSRCFRQQFLHVRCAMPLTARLLTTAPAVLARCDFFAHPRAAVDRTLPARFSCSFRRLHCRAARRCAACAGRTGPPLAAACSRALRLLGSSARPRLRLLRALHSADMSLSVFLSKSRGGATHR